MLFQLSEGWRNERRADARRIEDQHVVWLKTRCTKTTVPQSPRTKYELLHARRQADREKIEEAETKIVISEVMGTKRVGNLAETKHKRSISKANVIRKNGIRQTPLYPTAKTVKEVYLESWKPTRTWIPHHTDKTTTTNVSKTTSINDERLEKERRVNIHGRAANEQTLHHFLDHLLARAVDYFGNVCPFNKLSSSGHTIIPKLPMNEMQNSDR